MLWPFTNNHSTETTRDELIAVAEAYFRKHAYELTSGTVKGKLGGLAITVSFTVAEEERK